MTILFIFIFLNSIIIVLHIIKQKKNLLAHNKVADSLKIQIDLENQKNKKLFQFVKHNFNYSTNFKLDIIKKQIHFLEIVSNQSN